MEEGQQRLHLGHGVGLRSRHYARVLEGAIDVDWFEAISENFMLAGGRPLAVLERARREVPIVLHGVSLAIGSVDPLNRDYLSELGALADRIQPAWLSDHLCWGGFGGHYAHDLLPLPFTEEAVAHVVGRVAEVQERLGRRILLENVSSYVGYLHESMPEWEFLSEVARRSGCGILLDVNNVIVNARNHGFAASDYLAGLDRDGIDQIHLAGHTDRGSYLFDAHVGPVPESVWDLYREAIARFGPTPSLVEWDEQVPEWELLRAEASKAASIEREVLHEGSGAQRDAGALLAAHHRS